MTSFFQALGGGGGKCFTTFLGLTHLYKFSGTPNGSFTNYVMPEEKLGQVLNTTVHDSGSKISNILTYLTFKGQNQDSKYVCQKFKALCVGTTALQFVRQVKKG